MKLENRCSEIDTRRALQAASERVIGDFKGPQAFIYAAVGPVRLPPEREGVDADAILVIPRVIGIEGDGSTRPEDRPQRQRMLAVAAGTIFERGTKALTSTPEGSLIVKRKCQWPCRARSARASPVRPGSGFQLRENGICVA